MTTDATVRDAPPKDPGDGDLQAWLEQLGAGTCPGDVPLRKVEGALTSLHQAEREDGGALIRTQVATLVIVVTDHEAAQWAITAVDALGGQHPSRCVVLLTSPPGEHTETRAWPRVVVTGGKGDRSVTWELVVVRTAVQPRHLSTVVLPLLVPELPVFTWWVGTPPFTDEVFSELTAVADRLVVDSASFADPVDDLSGLAKLVQVAGERSRRPSRAACAVSDCVWGRLTAWRELLAAPFDGPALRQSLEHIEAVDVRVGDWSAGLLVAGWLASRLDWTLEAAERKRNAVTGHYRSGRRRIVVRVEGGERDVTLASAELRAGPNGEKAVIKVERAPEHLTATVQVTGHPPSERRVGRGRREGLQALAGELGNFGRDPVYEAALVHAATLAEGSRS